MSTNKIEKRINFARGAIGITIGLCALVTISLFGANMDAAHFPGSNIKLEVYPESSVKKGQYVAVLDGYLLEIPLDTADATCYPLHTSDQTACELSGSVWTPAIVHSPTVCSNFAHNANPGNAAEEGSMSTILQDEDS